MRPAFLGEKALLRIGTEQRPAPDYVLPEGDSFTKKFDLTAPPMMSAVLQFTQVEVLMTSYATLIAVNPISGGEYEIDIRVDVLQPIKYSYTINTSPLRKNEYDSCKVLHRSLLRAYGSTGRRLASRGV